MEVLGVILAAGDSKRMGSPKALLSWQGRTFLERIEEGLLGAGVRQLCVVVGEWAKGMRLPLARAKVLVNPHPEPGPISSLRIALREAPAEARFALVALVDHPAVAAETYRALVAQAREGEALIPTFEGRGGHPVLYPREMFPLLLDETLPTARDAMARYASVRRWECGDRGVRADIDTPEDLDRMDRSLAYPKPPNRSTV